MENYFVVLELPGKAEGEANAITSEVNFWQWTRELVLKGCAKVISSRKDTGVSEELKSYVGHISAFTTFVLLQTPLEPKDLGSTDSLFSVLASSININSVTEVLDQTTNFRVLAQA